MKKGELWRVRLPALGGRSQHGIRPVVVLADHNLPVVVIVPCTSNLEALRFRFSVRVNPSANNGLDTASVAMAFQLIAVDRRFFEEKIGVLEKPFLDELDQTVKSMLAL
jgi:mRNA-degrading endonuclease toxin of MazEF toxin-antitoxin module